MFLTAQGGILGPFAWILGKLFDLIYNLLANDAGIANLALCIIIFTVIVRLLIFPLSFKQQKSSKINMIISPEIQKIQKKYKDKKDQESMMRQQREMQAVYDKYGTSMTSGCLPSLIQLPIIYALYRVINNIPAYVGSIKNIYTPIAESIMSEKGAEVQQFLVDYVKEEGISGANYAASQFGKLSEVGVDNVIDVISHFGVSQLHTLLDTLGLNFESNLKSIEQMYSFILGINISETPGYKISWALIVPILSAVFSFISMKVSSANQQQLENNSANSMLKTMQITMPVMSILICISLPVGVGIYWAVGYLVAIFTQLIINFYYDRMDMDALLEKQMAIAAEKKEKRGGKKSFMERMMEESQYQQEELEKREAMRKNAANSLKNYVPSEESRKIVEGKKGKQYKTGSIGAKANILSNYNHNEKKEDK